MATQRRYSDEQREEIRRLVNSGHSYDQTIELCSRGVSGLEPFTPAKSTISDIVNAATNGRNGHETTAPPTDGELGDKFDLLARRALVIIGGEFDRITDTQGSIDADSLWKLSKAMRELEPLVKPQPNGNGDDRKPTGTLATLSSGDPPTHRQSNGGPGTVTPLRTNGLTPPDPSAA